MTWLVFWGEARQEHHLHPLSPAMSIPLVLLAAGTLTSWLLAGPLSHALHGTLPFHDLHALTLGEMVAEVLSWGTAVALAIVLLGMVIWWQRERLRGVVAQLRWLEKTAVNSFGFELINHSLTVGAQRAGALLQKRKPGSSTGTSLASSPGCCWFCSSYGGASDMDIFAPISLILIPLIATPFIYLGGRLANCKAGDSFRSPAGWPCLPCC